MSYNVDLRDVLGMDWEWFYSSWINEIVLDIESGACPDGIIDHIMKHATNDLSKHLQEKEPDWRRWSASMHNLLAIFDKQYLYTPISAREKLLRLLDQYERKPDIRTPPPTFHRSDEDALDRS